MQNRYIDRERYFNELAETSAGYYIDYIKRFKDIDKNSRIMEIGCGEGGNLVGAPLAGRVLLVIALTASSSAASQRVVTSPRPLLTGTATTTQLS